MLEIVDSAGRTVGLEPRSRYHGDPRLAHRAVHNVRTFELRHPGPSRLHPSQISDGRFWSAAELKQAAGGGSLTPNLEHELRLLSVLP